MRRQPSVTVVVPISGRDDGVADLVAEVAQVREAAGLDLELIFVGDEGGGSEVLRALGCSWVRTIGCARTGGPSQAVLDGFRHAAGDVLVAMRVDLGHPPDKIPELLDALGRGADMVVGSRFLARGTRIASLLAMPLARLSDPLSDFFALRRSTFVEGGEFDPFGYAAGLELSQKCNCKRIVEIPLDRVAGARGRRTLSLAERLEYLRQVRRLCVYKYGTWSHLVQFLGVGASGLAVNLAVLTALLRLSADRDVAIALAIALSMAWNFALNRRFSFSYARGGSIVRQFMGFVAACSLGAVVNYAVTATLWDAVELKQAAAIAGVIAGTGFNFLTSRFVVFRE